MPKQQSKCKPCAAAKVKAKRSTRAAKTPEQRDIESLLKRAPVGLAEHAQAFRKRHRKDIDKALANEWPTLVTAYAVQCARSFAKKQRKAAGKIPKSLKTRSATTDPCDPLRVAVAAQQLIVDAARDNLLIEEMTLMVLAMWLMGCTMGSP